MNNTHVYNLRRTPVGYNGPTSMYEGTRVISITEEPIAEKGGRKSNIRPSAKAPESSGRIRSTQGDRRIGGPVRGEGRRGGADRNVSASRQAQTHQAQNAQRRTSTERKPQQMQRQVLSRAQSEQPKQTPSDVRKNRFQTQNERRVLSRSQAATGDFTSGINVSGRVGIPYDKQRVYADRRVADTTGKMRSVRGVPTEHGDKRTDMTPEHGGYDRPIRRETDHGVNRRGADARVVRGDGSRSAPYPTAPNKRGPRLSYTDRGTDLRQQSPSNGELYNREPIYSYGSRSSGAVKKDVHNGSYGQPHSDRTPNRKVSKKQQNKPTNLSPEEKQMMRAAEAARKKAEKQIYLEQKSRKAKKRKQYKHARRIRRRAAVKEFRSAAFRGIVRSVPFVMLFFMAFAIALGLFAGTVFAALHINISGLPDTITYQIGEDEAKDKETLKLSTERFLREGTVYMSMDDFADRFEYTVVGNSTDLKYLSRNGSDIVKITIGSSAVTVNGVPIRLSAPVIRDGEEILAPFDFFASYTTGFSLSYNEEEHKIIMLREITGYSVSVSEGKTPIYANASFKPSVMEMLPKIAEGSLPSDILAATDPNPPPPETDEFGNPITDNGSAAPAG